MGWADELFVTTFHDKTTCSPTELHQKSKSPPSTALQEFVVVPINGRINMLKWDAWPNRLRLLQIFQLYSVALSSTVAKSVLFLTKIWRFISTSNRVSILFKLSCFQCTLIKVWRVKLCTVQAETCDGTLLLNQTTISHSSRSKDERPTFWWNVSNNKTFPTSIVKAVFLYFLKKRTNPQFKQDKIQEIPAPVPYCVFTH